MVLWHGLQRLLRPQTLAAVLFAAAVVCVLVHFAQRHAIHDLVLAAFLFSTSLLFVLWQFLALARSSAKTLQSLVDERTAALRDTGDQLRQEIARSKQTEEALRIAHDEQEQRVLERTSELRRSEEKYRTLFETIPHGIQEIDTSGVITFGNTAYYRLLQYEPEEILGKYIWDLLSDDLQKNELKSYLKELVRDQPPRTPYSQTSLTKHGEPIDVQVDWNYMRDQAGTVQGFVSVITDITQRKRAEQRLEAEDRILRSLLDLQEQERKLIAHEIHDGIVQDIVGAKMLYEATVEQFAEETQRGSGQTDQILKLLGRAVAESRRLIGGLRPMVLDEKGIVEAIKHLVCGEYDDPSFQVELQLPLKTDRFHPMLEGTLYRIVQEALRNAKQYSQCAAAVVKLVQRGRQLLLEIRDHGVGFDPGEVSESHFGLRGIYERARLFGGHATIESAPGQGCWIMVELPVVERVLCQSEGEETGDHEDSGPVSR